MKWIKKIKKVNFTAFMQGVFLLIIAILFTAIFTVISIIARILYNLITLKFQTSINQFGAYLRNMAMSINQFANVSCAGSLNFLMVKFGGYRFGDPDDDIAYVLGRNKYKAKLTIFGLFIVWVLCIIEKNIVDDAIVSKVEDDQDATMRCQKNEYYE